MVARKLLKTSRAVRMWVARDLKAAGVRKTPRRVRGHYRIRDRKAFEDWLKEKWLLNSSYQFNRPTKAQGETSLDHMIRVQEARKAWEKEQKQNRRDFMAKIFSLPRKPLSAINPSQK